MKRYFLPLIVSGCVIAGCSSEPSAREPAPATQPVEISKDAAVLDAVLLDVLTFDGKSAPRDTRYGDKDHILVQPHACQYKITLDRVLLKKSKDAWAALSVDTLSAAESAAKDLVRRFDAGEGFESFEPSDPRIGMQADPPATKPGLRMDRPICAWAPGYSADGNIAVVRLSIPWSIHHADGVYVLEKRGTTWSIVLRDFVYYF